MWTCVDPEAKYSPEQVCNAGPPGRIPTSSCGTRFLRKHKRQSPTLRWVALLWVELRSGIRLLGFGSWNTLTSEVGELFDLVLCSMLEEPQAQKKYGSNIP